jgi:hypothetical protein
MNKIVSRITTLQTIEYKTVVLKTTPPHKITIMTVIYSPTLPLLYLIPTNHISIIIPTP